MKVAIPKEIAPGENRVAGTPETVRQLVKAGLAVAVEAGAGVAAGFPDAEYQAAEATIQPQPAELLGEAELVLKVQKPFRDPQTGQDELERLHRGQTLVSFLHPLVNLEQVQRLAEAGITSFAMDAIPRLTRAQPMDALSSQSTVAGYKAVILAADAMVKMMPMLMTAAGTIRPASALVIGAGVAGLQAIATARRLGAVVKALDVRPGVREQVESLGAKFVSMETSHEDSQDTNGYATDLGEEFYRQEQGIIAPHLKDADLVIATALIPGRPAPRLITEAMVKSMKPGSVIVDLAAEAGGNCTLTQPGQRVERYGVLIFGPLNLASTLPLHASQMYARNIAAFVAELVKDGQIQIDPSNEIIHSTLITRDGQVVHEPTQRLIAGKGGRP